MNTSAIDEIARRRGRKHAGLAIGVDLDGETSTFGRGRLGPDRPQSPAADTIFEIGSITKVFTATVLADMAEEGLVALYRLAAAADCRPKRDRRRRPGSPTARRRDGS